MAFTNQPAAQPPASASEVLGRVLAWLRLLRRRPLMLCCVAFVSGMGLAGALAPPLALCGVAALGLLAIALSAARLHPDLSLASLVLAFAAAGALVHGARTALPPDDVSLMADQRNLSFIGTVVSHPRDRGWYQTMHLRIRRVRDEGGAAQTVSGSAVLRISSAVELALGDHVRVGGASVRLPPTSDEPGEFDYRGWLRRQGVTALMNARAVRVIGTETGWRTRIAHLGLGLREAVVEGIERSMPGVDGALYSRLLIGMVYGLTAGPLPEDVIEQFRRAGTIHLLVVSGAQISIIALAVVGMTGRRLTGGIRWWQGLLVGFCVAVLVLIVGIEASIGRAMAMFALILMASITSRDYDTYTAIAFAAAVICLFDPWALSTLSFQLTFTATLGIVLFLPREPLRRISNDVAAPPLPQLRAVFWATLGAWVLTSPVLAHSVAQFAVSGNLANLVNVPLSLIIRILGFVALPIAVLSCLTPVAFLAAPLLTGICWMARGLLRMVMHVNALAIGLPLAFAHDLHIGAFGVFICYLAIAALFALGLVERVQRSFDEMLLRPHPSWPVVAGFAFVALLVTSHLFAGAPRGQLEMTVLPVGAGQAVVIRTPQGRSLVIDCGSGSHAETGRDVAEQTILPHLVARGIERLDAVVISHWHSDHCNALPRVLSGIRADLLLMPPELQDSVPPERLRPWLRTAGRRAAAGAEMTLGDDLRVRILAPRQPLLVGTRDDPNNNSVVVMVEHGDVRLMLPGDLEAAGARRLLRDARAAGWSLRADVLVLPHHGRGLMELLPLLDAVRPGWAIASCDYQADEYLDANALAELERRGIRLLRTDEHGKITVFSDGRRLRVTTTRGSLATGAWIEAAR